MQDHIIYNEWSQPLVEKTGISGLIKQYQAQLKAFIRKRVDSKEDAEDILQEVFFQLVKADNLIKPIEHVSAWLYRVARNQIIDWSRKKREEEIPVFQDDDDEYIFKELSDVLLNEKSTPETEYLRSMVWTELESALSELPPEQKEIFEQTELQGLSLKEISSQSGVPINTLLSRKRYAVLHLRDRLKDLYYELLEN